MSRPSAPGVSVDISGAAKVAARRIRRLGRAVPIDFNLKAGTENELMAWYRGRSDGLVRALQLRQEREGPYFHQFIVFELQDGGGLFRIDRRLRPNEDAPMNSLKDEGIPAFDTIEPVVAWDDPLFPASDCLISIEFKVDVYLALILKICRAIQEHPLAQVYTLQRYNCYFFAQTITMCAACGAVDWARIGICPLKWLPTLNSNTGFLKFNESAHEHADYSEVGHTSTPINITTQFTHKGHKLTLALARRTSLPRIPHYQIDKPNIVAPSWKKDDVESLRHKIDTSVQYLLETYWKEGPIRRVLLKYLMAKESLKISKDLSSFSPYMPRLPEIVIEVRSAQETRLGPGQAGALMFQIPIYKPVPSAIGYQVGLQKRRGVVISDSFGIHLSNWHQWMELIGKVKRREEHSPMFSSLGQVSGSIDDECLDWFKQSMVIRVVYKAIVQQDTPQETTPNSNMENIPRYRRPRRMIFGWRKGKQGKEQQMTPATITDMQEYLLHLIRAHSIRVEQYKRATKAIALDVVSDIGRAMDEVWDKLIE
ncbi:hypothetical protein RSOL_072940 [Rhizoctonia solani AG-3 Rhs1AP]|uniref:Uncharacterized protein n=2 Tax=Rhizoctonia solani AG-3 TaxID=1086053 RepID=A0A074RUT7_9AGAM|nr:hypothetical protein RSOL_072940 [Rhizoctonia solani AG-3 Rhs1AP]KEP48403.1 hypothetical protein V565_125650 [Rhizoctonia solani 123E]